MSLDQLFSQFDRRQDSHGLEAQLHALRREVRRISRGLSKEAHHNLDDWSDNLMDAGREAARQGAHLAEFAGEQAWRGARAVKRDPLPAIALVGTALLVASLMRRR
ncbi:MAG: hypothetical protein ABS75_32960 [Pelagibacterium sp. SCN 63-23]|nr:MAG: hypothetical protein ABS75_32960 [Pelagibacterium sp. SCN 63-23]